MKTLNFNLILVIAIAFAFTAISCEKTEISSVDQEVAEFNDLLAPNDGSDKVNCSFGGVIEAKVRIGHFIGVNEFPHQFGSDAVVTWTIDGQAVTPRRSRFVRLNDHLSQPAIVDVCYSVSSSACGTLGDCITVNF